ncbi:MAG: hypothetical protein ACD_73C00279G0004 [uncultured bacterium]|nr:MAG: hypothetical protein ACD_73C00279G0004 [uncultured bacterium]
MSLFQSVLLGAVQGLGEFLPISSSAHLVMTPWLFGFSDPGLTFDVALHFGTLIAIVAFFWRDWWQISVGSFRYLFQKKSLQDESDLKKNQYSWRLMVYLVLATIPGALIGKLFEEMAETSFRHPLLIAFNMSLMGSVLFWADSKKQGVTDLPSINLKQALVIGFSQALAIVPGVSRSGITMTTGLILGLNRITSARFSFLLAMPITFGACLLKAKDFFSVTPSFEAMVGILVSALVGFLSIKYLLKYVQVKDYRPFCYYRFLFTFVVLLVYFLR